MVVVGGWWWSETNYSVLLWSKFEAELDQAEQKSVTRTPLYITLGRAGGRAGMGVGQGRGGDNLGKH